MLGTDISLVEVSGITKHGFWLLLDEGEELLIPFSEFPMLSFWQGLSWHGRWNPGIRRRPGIDTGSQTLGTNSKTHPWPRAMDTGSRQSGMTWSEAIRNSLCRSDRHA